MQRWIGDLVDVGPGRFVGNKVRVPMSTAIVRTYCVEGFVLAADGRACGAEDRKPVTDTAQKIFPIGGGSTKFLAYSISGTPCIASRDANELAFDFVTEINKAVQVLSTRRYDTLANYAKKACRAVHQKLKAARLTGQLVYPDEAETLDPSERGSTIVRIFIDGYHRSIPTRVKVRFFHVGQVLADLEVLQQELATESPWMQGSNKVCDLLFSEDETKNAMFAAYKRRSVDLVSHSNETLRIYAQMAQAYISACSGPEALAMDPKPCAGIGGHIHIATITPKDGFQWVPGFAPMLPNGI